MMLSQQLKTLREAKGLTQLELSRDLDIAPSTVGMYETGRREPDYDNLKKLARYFKVSPNELIGWNDTQNVQVADEEEYKLVSIYRRLNPADRRAAFRMLSGLCQQAAPA